MLMTILTILTILADIGVGAAAYKLAKTVEKNQKGHDSKLTEQAQVLLNHEERIKSLEVQCSTQLCH